MLSNVECREQIALDTCASEIAALYGSAKRSTWSLRAFEATLSGRLYLNQLGQLAAVPASGKLVATSGCAASRVTALRFRHQLRYSSGRRNPDFQGVLFALRFSA